MRLKRTFRKIRTYSKSSMVSSTKSRCKFPKVPLEYSSSMNENRNKGNAGRRLVLSTLMCPEDIMSLQAMEQFGDEVHLRRANGPGIIQNTILVGSVLLCKYCCSHEKFFSKHVM